MCTYSTTDVRTHQIPRKVIDCEQLCVVNAPQDCRYAALSYVWGAGGQLTGSSKEQPAARNVGDSDNVLAARQECVIDGKPVEAVVADAIVVTSGVGLRYLWVDRWCIPQEESESRRMELVNMDAQRVRIISHCD